MTPMIGTRTVARLTGVVIAGLMATSAIAGTAQAGSAATARALGVQPAAADPAANGKLQLHLTGMSPSAAVPDNDLVITGTARNSGAKPMKHVQVGLRLRPTVLAGRQAIDTWLSGDADAGYEISPPGSADLKTIPAGASKRFTITIKAGQLGLSGLSSSFGPRAITLEATNQRFGHSDPLGTLRSTIVWAPGEPTVHTRLSLLVPITASKASTQAGQPTSDVAQTLLPGGRLQKIVAATADPAISWAIDPALLASAQRLIDDGVTADTDSSTDAVDDPTAPVAAPTTSASAPTTPAITNADAAASARDWLERIRSGRTGRSALGLPFADPDVNSVLSTKKSSSLLKHSDVLGKTTAVRVLGTALDTTVVWPADGEVTPSAISTLRRGGRKAVVLDGADQQPDPAVDYTPSGHSTLRSGTSTLTGLLYDDQLSTLLTATGSASQSAAATQTLLAQLAAIAREQPDDTRQVLAVTPRGWNPTPTGVQSLMTALRSAPWVNLKGMTSLRKVSSPPRNAPTYSRSAVSGQLPPGQITSALAMSRDLDIFEPALITSAPVVDPLREQVASLLSVAWRSDRARMSSERSVVRGHVDALTGGVSLSVGNTKWLLTAHSGPFPIYVVNDTTYPIRIRVDLHPESGQLSTTLSEPVTIQGHTHTTVLVKARAIASGNVQVDARLRSARDGGLLTPTVEFTVRVRPNWESRGMVAAVIVLGFLLVIGLIRSIRRRRRPRVPLDSVPDVDDLAVQRATDTGSLPVQKPQPVPADSSVTSAS